MEKVSQVVNEDLFKWMRDIRREIHQWPEGSFDEHRTAGLVSNKLKEIGIDHRTGVAKTGVLGRLITDSKAPTVALRADMDAIAVQENTGLLFSSRVPGLMHACGHDGHVAIILGAARLLKEQPPDGNVVFIFQPGEEGGGGAKPMIEEGALDGVDVIFGGHIERTYRVGEIAIKNGIHTAYTDMFVIDITGKGGHAARPHDSVDAIVIAAQFVNFLQTIVSRELDPLQHSVITVGVLNAGTASNAIAENAVLKGTIRTTESFVRTRVMDRIKSIATSLTSLHGAKIDVTIKKGYPPVINHERECGFARVVASILLGEENVIEIPKPSLGGEDFSFFTREIPGCFLRFGAAKEGSEYESSHSPRFDFDEDVLKVGAAFMSELTRYVLNQLGKPV
jgi:hippurate hydrolase